jgi:hypothetical protein
VIQGPKPASAAYCLRKAIDVSYRPNRGHAEHKRESYERKGGFQYYSAQSYVYQKEINGKETKTYYNDKNRHFALSFAIDEVYRELKTF